MRKNFKRVVSCVAALAVFAATFNVANVDAAKKPKLSKKSVKMSKGKSYKVKVQGVKAVKKLTVKSSKKKVATVKKNGKKAFTIKAKAVGSAKITAKVKVKKKTTKLTCKVTVINKKSDSTTDTSATAASTAAASATAASANASAAASSAATTAPTAKASEAAPVSSPEATVEATTAPTAEPTEAPILRPQVSVEPDATERPGLGVNEELVNLSFDFEDSSVGPWEARTDTSDNNEQLIITDEGHESSHAMAITNRDGHSWNGPCIQMTGNAVPGASYKFSFWAKIFQEEGITSGKSMPLRVSGAKIVGEGEKESYENYPRDTDYTCLRDEWTYHEVTFTTPSAFVNYIFYIESNGKGKVSFMIDDVKFERTAVPAAADLTLDSIKDTFKAAGIDTVGTATTYDQILNPNIAAFINYHYNSITYGNDTKPDSLMGSGDDAFVMTETNATEYVLNDTYATREDNLDADGNVILPSINFEKLDYRLKAAKKLGVKVRLHTLIWHQQMPRYFFAKKFTNKDEKNEDNLVKDKATMLDREEMYIRTVMRHVFNSEYKDVVYAVDVVNEFTHSDNQSEQEGSGLWWKYAFPESLPGKAADGGQDNTYVKWAFKWAYDELEKVGMNDKVSLIYNDYSEYTPNIRDAIVKLINDINTKDDVINTDGAKICDGVGMQSHINEGNVAPKADGLNNYQLCLKAFQDNGFEIQVTELDIASPGKVTADSTAEEKAKIEASRAEAWKNVITYILQAKKDGANITSVTIWGINDATSWLQEGSPCLFGTDISDKKPAFDAVIEAAKAMAN